MQSTLAKYMFKNSYDATYQVMCTLITLKVKKKPIESMKYSNHKKKFRK